MSIASLSIDLGALTRNWKRLDAMTGCETSAVIKANAYGLGMSRVAKALAEAGARTYFVATAEEGTDLRAVLGPEPSIYVLSGHMKGATAMIRDMGLIPMIVSADQLVHHLETLPDAEFGIQLDTGMNRLGMEPEEWAAVRDAITGHPLVLLSSHLACADEPDHEMNERQLASFIEMSEGFDVPRSFANTGGVMLGSRYHFDLSRPGIGTYGGLPFADAEPVVTLDLPVIQCRTIEVGESVGYGNAYIAATARRVATVAAGYADGILRAGSGRMLFWSEGQPCPVLGRISMDSVCVDVSNLEADPETLRLLGPEQTVDDLAEKADTIGYEILTSLGSRYKRTYINP